MSTTPADRQATLSSWMEDVDPKYRSHTYWLMTHNIDPNLYWKWDTVPTRPPGDYVGQAAQATVKREGFCGDMHPEDCPICRAVSARHEAGCGCPFCRMSHQGGCKCSCNSCPDCGMSMCSCRCSQMNRMIGSCGHHRGKALMILLILVALGVLVFTMDSE